MADVEAFHQFDAPLFLAGYDFVGCSCDKRVLGFQLLLDFFPSYNIAYKKDKNKDKASMPRKLGIPFVSFAGSSCTLCLSSGKLDLKALRRLRTSNPSLHIGALQDCMNLPECVGFFPFGFFAGSSCT